ncbi:DUF3908 family protein [Bacillus cereus]|uniref:DUF3908 domain-containing protein n=1 Tax=Bacillus cereus (strain 03BB102) TaxID=572264 RepID=A0A158RG52_BACC3|nr:DUF3908 family protein [Bacillus cereus]ACO25915.1 conserved hypothetical protein [Bacillus cereus 03BB102]AJG52295.1 hypothetical protein AS54_1935 [Bacillus cereus 03BB102]QPR83017.1 DUF3908 family protein [Bacillus cereus]
MFMTYAQFVESTKKREFEEYHQFLRLQKELEELYDVEKDFVFFYPKNLFNNKELEFIIFLEDGFLIIENAKNGYRYEQFYCELVSKSLVRDDFNNSNQQLKLVFDNGKELMLNSLADSNQNWINEYASAIKELYKIILR